MSETEIRRSNLHHAPLWVHGAAWGFFGLITLALVVLYYAYMGTDVWYLWMGNVAPERHSFNEAIYSASLFRQPANTWSNLSYVFVGLYVLAFAWWDMRRATSAKDPHIVRQPMMMVLFGVYCVMLGFGSGLMHASMTSIGHKADVFAMYGVLVVLVAMQWSRWLPELPFLRRRIPTWPLFFVAGIVGSIVVFNYRSELGSKTIMFSLIGLIALGNGLDVLFGKTSQQYRYHVLSFWSMAIAYWIWNLDRAGQFSAPESWLQGHAIWHLLTGVALGTMALFFRTEVPLAATVKTREPVPAAAKAGG